MEKLETVKKLVRANDYRNNDITFKQCLELGVEVNRVGLEIFAKKLRAMDHAANIESAKGPYVPESEADDESTASFAKKPLNYAVEQAIHTESFNHSNITSLNTVSNGTNGQQFDPKVRKKEITFELGSIRIREQELLKELYIIDNDYQAAQLV